MQINNLQINQSYFNLISINKIVCKNNEKITNIFHKLYVYIHENCVSESKKSQNI